MTDKAKAPALRARPPTHVHMFVAAWFCTFYCILHIPINTYCLSVCIFEIYIYLFALYFFFHCDVIATQAVSLHLGINAGPPQWSVPHLSPAHHPAATVKPVMAQDHSQLHPSLIAAPAEFILGCSGEGTNLVPAGPAFSSFFLNRNILLLRQPATNSLLQIWAHSTLFLGYLPLGIPP